ncbi:MAG: tyrosine-type recombinase/integrase [Syntrophorhabdaceae bacterium]|jgi:integrase|nr:tyrosine-type recombinase/integrase [Syntrophorhabdaceae bacterium]
MSQYFKKGKGWRYDFTQRGERYTEAWFKTKQEAKMAESKRREELKEKRVAATRTDMGFLELVNERLDYVKAYKSKEYYKAYCYMAIRWVERWGKLGCQDITTQMVEEFLVKRSTTSVFAANKDLRHLRATFNFGKKRKVISIDPTAGIDFFPIEKKIRYIPSVKDINKVISFAAPDVRDYLWVIRDTMARVDEINRLTWDDVFFEGKGGHVVLYTRKKRGGNLTPRKIPMTKRLYEILARRFASRDVAFPWVFCNVYVDWKSKETKIGPYRYRKTLLNTLCTKAKVRRFGYHALRHSGASIMASQNVPIGVIQNILGHENRTTTEIYLHSIGNTEKEAIRAYEEATTNPHTESHTALKLAVNS